MATQARAGRIGGQSDLPGGWPEFDRILDPVDFGALMAEFAGRPTVTEGELAAELGRRAPGVALRCRDLVTANPHKPAPWFLLGAASKLDPMNATVVPGNRSTARVLALGEIAGLCEAGHIEELASACLANREVVRATSTVVAGSGLFWHTVCALLPSAPDVVVRELLPTAKEPFVGWQVVLRELRQEATRRLEHRTGLDEAEEMLAAAVDLLEGWVEQRDPGTERHTVELERLRLVLLRARAMRKMGRFDIAREILADLPADAGRAIDISALRERVLIEAGLQEASALPFPESAVEYVSAFRELAPALTTVEELLRLRPHDALGLLIRGVVALVTGDNIVAARSLRLASRVPPDAWEGTIEPFHSELVGHMALACIRTANRDWSRYGAEQLLELVDWGCAVSFRVLVEACTLLDRQHSEILPLIQTALDELTGLAPEALRSLGMLFDRTNVWSEAGESDTVPSSPLFIGRLASRLNRN